MKTTEFMPRASATVEANPTARPLAPTENAETTAQFVAGIVVAKTGAELALRQPTGEPVSVALTPETVYAEGEEELAILDLAVGDAVTVIVKTADDGRIEAENVARTNLAEPLRHSGSQPEPDAGQSRQGTIVAGPDHPR